MGTYQLPHNMIGERERLALMSTLLDPMERMHLQQLGVRPGWRCLEIGCGNGSVSRWLAEQVAPGGHVVASDLDVSYLDGLRGPSLEVRQLDVLAGPLEEGAYDLVLARAVLHHLAEPKRALERMIAALKPGGLLLSIEPDALPIQAAEPELVYQFWQGWWEWSITAGIDYGIGRTIARWLDCLGLEGVAGEGHTAVFSGGSPWAIYIMNTMSELRPKLLQSGKVTEEMLAALDRHYTDPHYWTSAINFVASWGRKPA